MTAVGGEGRAFARTDVSDAGVVVLGGTAGVGLETACAFAERGARLVLLGRDPARGAAARATVLDRVPGATVHFESVDASVPAAAIRAEELCRAHLGVVDVLVTTTGPSRPPRLLHTIALEDLRSGLDEVVMPALHLVHVVLPGMRERRAGAIVVVASDAAKVPTPGETVIGAAMAALLMFCRAAALEVKREGVRINVLTPSLIAGTPGAALIAAEPFSARMFEKAAGLAHLGVPDATDLAELAVFLASPAARRVTGQAISVNGGISVA